MPRTKWLPLVAICLGSFLLLVDVTIVTVALPDIAADLDAPFSGLQWVLDVYALVLAALLLAAGSAADVLGRRRTYLAGLGVFALASLGCGLAPDVGLLVAARGVQAIGGAAMFATTLALLNTTYTGRDRGIAFGLWGATSGAAAAVGPVLGGVLTQHLGWRSIFLVNLPVVALAVLLTLAVVTETRRSDGAHVDLWGTVTFTVAAGGVTFALIQAGDVGWGAASTLGLFAVAAVALVAFVIIERRVRHPLLDLTLLRSASFSAVLVAGLLLMAAAFANLAYTSVWLQAVLGLDPVGAGLALLPMAACSFAVSAVAGRFLQGVSPRLTVGVGLLLVGLGAYLQAGLDAGSSATAILPGLTVAGAGVGIAIPTLTAAAMGAAPPERGGMVAGALNTARQLGYALGIAMLGLVFRGTVEDRLTGAVPDPAALVGAITGGHALDLPVVRAAVAAGLDAGYLVSAGLGAAGGVLVLLLVQGAQATPHVAAAAPPRP